MNIVGIGGSTRAGSSTEALLRQVLAAVERRGAATSIVSGSDLLLPPYEPGLDLPSAASRLVAGVRVADAVVIGSPGYHGSVSGLVKNALDFLEELREDERPYLSQRAVGLAVTAYGWQAAVQTLAAARQIVHALRGWPTPLGLAVNVAGTQLLDDGGGLADPELRARVEQLADDLVWFAASARASALSAP